MPPTNPLTLIVATTPIPTREKTLLGIGLNGTLPWPRIKADMSFFARVTSRPPRPGTTNAMIMGRKTYDSVPKSLRPLGKRINVVVTRDVAGVSKRVSEELEGKRAKMAAAAAATAATSAGENKEEGPVTDAIGGLGNVFVIGGAEIYAAALRLGGDRPVRIVMTNVEKKGVDGEKAQFECDTFFPVDEELLMEKGWKKVSAEEVTEWVGEPVSGEWKDEGEVRIQMVGYERIY
ncbi:dihydrofolate reductase [Aspergillus nomiae NRRL 13137]|uniref:Dihydrofolate reductase n=1 Tax=Aspergillus nomiae NRRL (strain ATCC 15546 / NRRL 13137 / CBS 260.88 / M93) TaxID=1509407 RepID=A0A0L1IT88_ASPN3|nr:dihydrofolate reductase [Aspergillus nomiae NRRL 13137]KNG82699.1 dihydrofolate reductase [Aspergillus nomiae NRRL 13137]